MIIKLRNRSFFLLLLTDMRCKRIYQKSSSSHQQFHHTFSVSYIIIIIITYNLITTLTMYTNIFKALYLAATSTTFFFWKAPHIIRTNRKLYLIYASVCKDLKSRINCIMLTVQLKSPYKQIFFVSCLASISYINYQKVVLGFDLKNVINKYFVYIRLFCSLNSGYN